MDFVLPVAPALGVAYPRHWRDIPRSQPIEFTPPAYEPLSLQEAKRQIRIDSTSDDPWVDLAVRIARQQVENDTGRTFVRTVHEITFDQYPIERWIPCPKSPLISVEKFSWFDLNTSAESDVDASSYFLDTNDARVILNVNAVWPTGVRWQVGGRLRWKAGYTGAPITLTSLTRSGSTATATTSTPHGYTNGQRVTIAFADQQEYNGTFAIVVTGASSFTFAVTGTPASPATGSALSCASFAIPVRYVQAMQLLLGHFDQNREAVSVGRSVASVPLPLGYEALTSDRLVAFG